MAEEQDLTRAHIDSLEIFNKLFRAIFGKKEPDEYFKIQTPPDKQYIELTSMLDGCTYPCHSKESVQNAMRDIIGSTDMYNELLQKAAPSDLRKLRDVFTPEMFNRLGGQQSPILLNTNYIAITGGTTDSDLLTLNLSDGAAQKGIDSVSIKQSGNNEYDIHFNNHLSGAHIDRLEKVEGSNLKNEILRVTRMNEKAYLETKTGKKLFSENEVPKADLKKAGIDWKNLSEVNKKALLEGNETSPLTFTQKIGDKKRYTHGHLQLSRIGGNKAQAIFRPVQNAGMKMIMKL
ncbi:MAG: hypothetical protein LBP63_08340 [Prevotellaceae bacterium]|jgi:hypothetical protein|nr:hypothetical protein [Prevotellaceae bacterium]